MTIYNRGKRFSKLIRALFHFILSLLCFFLTEKYSQSADLFSVQSITLDGKILSVVPADLDDDGSAEIVVSSKTGVYPDEKRWISHITLL